MLSSTVSAKVKESTNKQITNVNYTYKLNINEPSYTTPVFGILDNSGDIMNTCSSIIVSKIKNYPCWDVTVSISIPIRKCQRCINIDTRK